ncbi:MAG: hypothetical protein WB755_25780 [Terriglobales bacterium]
MSQMLGLCSHDFLWPRRAADGDYYQVCRLCGVEHKYDWEHMRRKRSHPRLKPAAAPPSLRSNRVPDRKTASPVRLLLEREPAYRVFFGNLADLILRRTAPMVTTSETAAFWPDVFVTPPVPWPRLLESMLFHTIAITVLVILSQPWVQLDPLPRVVHRSYISYYSPSKTFPALRGSQTLVRKPPRKRRDTAQQKAAGTGGQNEAQKTEAQKTIKVAPESAAAGLKGPDVKLPNVKLPGLARPNIVASNVIPPSVPLSAIRRSQLTVPAGPTTIVAPPPEVSQGALNGGASRGSGLAQATVVAPAPEVGGASTRSGLSGLAAAIIAPPPVVQASIRRLGDLEMGASAVVAPAPRLPMDEQHLISGSGSSGRGSAGLGSSVPLAVPPPPSVQRSGIPSDGRGSGFSIAGLPVVPPPPSVLDAGNSGGGRGAGSLSGAGLQPVAPPPALQEAGNSLGSGRASALGGAGSQAVPPAPAMPQSGNSFGNGRGTSLSGSGLQGVPPAPSGPNGGGSGAGGTQVAMNIRPSIPPVPPAKTPKPVDPASEELPVRVIGLALSLPHSSYFSNYEVFIAERRRKDQPELIKLVYESLPYQRRLSEYGVDNTKVYRLRVSRDKSCDESLLQMTWPENDPHPDVHNSADAPGLSARDRNDMLPCYRTTADDYRRAISLGH